jgi:hypothetical protein
MITHQKLKIYDEYNGDIDSWARMGSRHQNSLMNDDDWLLIDSLIQDIILEKKGIISKEFSDSLHQKLIEVCDTKETINNLKKIADKKY